MQYKKNKIYKKNYIQNVFIKNKTITQMYTDLKIFIKNDVIPNLDYLNNKIKKTRPHIIIDIITLISSLIFLCIYLLDFSGCIIISYLLFWGIPNILIYNAFNKKYKKMVDSTCDTDIKQAFMPNFLKIFGFNISWQKENSIEIRMEYTIINRFEKAIENYWNNAIKKIMRNDTENRVENSIENKKKNSLSCDFYNSLCILKKQNVCSIDDIFKGEYNNVKFEVKETDTTYTSCKNFYSLLSETVHNKAWSENIQAIFISIILGGSMITFILASLIQTLLYKFYTLSLAETMILIATLLLTTFIVVLLYNREPFRGVFVSFDMNKNFEGHTFILERKFSNRGIKIDKKKYKKVILEYPEFNKKYIVYSDNQVEARYLLTTTFIERFMNLKTAFDAKYIRVSFKDQKIVIAIHTGKDLFTLGAFLKKTEANAFVVLFKEIISILELSTTLKLYQKTGL